MLKFTQPLILFWKQDFWTLNSSVFLKLSFELTLSVVNSVGFQNPITYKKSGGVTFEDWFSS